MHELENKSLKNIKLTLLKVMKEFLKKTRVPSINSVESTPKI